MRFRCHSAYLRIERGQPFLAGGAERGQVIGNLHTRQVFVTLDHGDLDNARGHPVGHARVANALRAVVNHDPCRLVGAVRGAEDRSGTVTSCRAG